MEILDAETRSVLEIIAFSERTNRPLLWDALKDFASEPKRKTTTTGFPAFIVQERATEKVSEFIYRAKLIQVESDGAVRLTELGRIVLAGATEQEATENTPQDIVLAAGDQWATIDLLRAVKHVGKCLVVDPYGYEDQIFQLVKHTEAERILIGPSPAKQDFGLILGAIQPPRRLELRVSKEIHDRHVIPPSGKVLALGASMNGVGQDKPTILIHLSEDLSVSVRKTYEEIWSRASLWTLTPPPQGDP
ncbi:MAG: hypothetical protein ACR2FO_02635 [Actinomycetota bacterium]